LNLAGRHCDQRQGTLTPGNIFMESIRQDNADSIPLRNSPPGVGILLIRFIGLLAVAVVVLALLWSR
jgi:hypothetical protein